MGVLEQIGLAETLLRVYRLCVFKVAAWKESSLALASRAGQGQTGRMKEEKLCKRGEYQHLFMDIK